METVVIPRANANYLNMYVERVVRLIGRVTRVEGTRAIIDSAGSITITSFTDSDVSEGHIYELTGRVGQDMSIEMLNCYDFGTTGDLDNANAMVELYQKNQEFYRG
ncbi:replication factor A protein 3 [Lipomyces oligophaga]|uniref:replication factor A protein 3 n=1 Tax=Lipomyces oligophaga TaxID=45792 RepID=UPI0034CF62F9